MSGLAVDDDGRETDHGLCGLFGMTAGAHSKIHIRRSKLALMKEDL